MKRALLLLALSGGAIASPETLLDDGPGHWGWVLGPELRITPDGLGIGAKAGVMRFAGDHGLLVGGQFNQYQLGTPGTDKVMNQYGLLLGYRYMPYAVGHLDTEVILGLISQNDGTNAAASAYGAEINTAWKINVHPNIQVGVGVGAILSGQPDSDVYPAVETYAGRLVFEFGSF